MMWKHFLFAAVIMTIGITGDAVATNIEAVLDDAAGGSSFSIQDSGTNQVFSINSNGQATAIDGAWIGLGATAGRIEFDSQTPDEINFLNCRVGIGTTTPSTILDLIGDIRLGAGGEMRLCDSDSSNFIALQAPTNVPSDLILTLPSADGSDGQVVSTNGSGTLQWVDNGANRTLSNLTDGGIAINTSLVSDTTNNDDLGSTSIEWRNLYLSGPIRFGETTKPSATVNKGFLYVKDNSGDTELFYEDDDGQDVQITSNGNLATATGTYTGNGTSQSITVGWRPKQITLVNSTNRQISLKNDAMPGDDFLGATTWVTTNGITVTSTGFNVGSSVLCNRNASTYYWTTTR